MKGFLFLAAAAACLPLPGVAVAQDITLQADQGVTLRLERGQAVASERGPAEWTAHDVAIARRFVGGDFNHAVGPVAAPEPFDGTIPEPRPIPSDTIRIRFFNLADRHALLVIENGYGSALHYRAAIARGNRGATTDVCVVLPNRRGFEHWPYPIDHIILMDLRLEPWNEANGVTCE